MEKKRSHTRRSRISTVCVGIVFLKSFIINSTAFLKCRYFVSFDAVHCSFARFLLLPFLKKNISIVNSQVLNDLAVTRFTIRFALIDRANRVHHFHHFTPFPLLSFTRYPSVRHIQQLRKREIVVYFQIVILFSYISFQYAFIAMIMGCRT